MLVVPAIGWKALPPATVTWQYQNYEYNINSPYTFTGATLGTASEDRIIILGVTLSGVSGSVTAATIGGVTATYSIGVGTGDPRAELWAAAVPTGTTGNIVITFTGGGGNKILSVMVWSTTKLQSVTPTGTWTSTADPAQVDMDIASGGLGLGYSHGDSGSGGGPSATWTGLTESSDQQLGNGHSHSGAHLASSGVSGLTAQIDWSSASKRATAFAAYR